VHVVVDVHIGRAATLVELRGIGGRIVCVEWLIGLECERPGEVERKEVGVADEADINARFHHVLTGSVAHRPGKGVGELPPVFGSLLWQIVRFSQPYAGPILGRAIDSTMRVDVEIDETASEEDSQFVESVGTQNVTVDNAQILVASDQIMGALTRSEPEVCFREPVG
jgi:hypothetical protein